MTIENNRYIREVIHNILLKSNTDNGINSINKWLNYAEQHGLVKAIEKINDSYFNSPKGATSN